MCAGQRTSSNVQTSPAVHVWKVDENEKLEDDGIVCDILQQEFIVENALNTYND